MIVNVPMAAKTDGTPGSWLALAPVCKNETLEVFDLRFSDGRCVRVEP